MKIVVTGAAGLIGWHVAARLHAINCAARFKGENVPFDLRLLDRAAFEDDGVFQQSVLGAEAIIHCAGVNRVSNDAEFDANVSIATRLVEFCRQNNATPHIVYTNSIHCRSGTAYGHSKKAAGDVLAGLGGVYTDLILPHIFGECARPNYNNVTATFIDTIIRDTRPDINPNGYVTLLHAGAAADIAIDAVCSGRGGFIEPEARQLTVRDLFQTLEGFHKDYADNIFPELQDPFMLALFNTYRSALYPDFHPRELALNTDSRGTLFEAVKGRSGGQVFLSTTKPGVVRGNHFHLDKVERFLVVKGEAIIRMRKVLSDRVLEFRVSGDHPAPVDMPTLYTHSIVNVGDDELLTLFWSNDLFNPEQPDTYADPVMGELS